MSESEPSESDQTMGYQNISTDDLADRPDGSTSDSMSVPTGHAATPGSGPQRGESGVMSRISSSLKSRATMATNINPILSSGSAAASLIPPEALIGPYEILDELGKGGMGVVYRARHIHLNRIAALKMILGGAWVSSEHRERFRIEAEAVAKIDHPNVVRIYDVGVHDGNPYIALELIEGGNLQTKAGGKPQNPKYAVTIVESIARAVHEAHTKGIIHRDLKPANVMLTLDGQPKVTDFGLAKEIGEGQTAQTNAGSILGTPSYMAPEQAAGRVLDIGPGTDVYALGAILYELLVGHPPFRAETAIATIRLVLDGEVVSPRALLETIPKDLDTICLKALEKPIHRRYESAEALAEDLRRYLDDEPIHARPIGRVERFGKWIRRKPARAATLGTGLIAAIVILTLGIGSYYAVTKRAHEAETAKSVADTALDTSMRRLVRLNVENGTRLMEDQDFLGSVLWFAEALKLEAGGIDRERMHRTRIAAVLARCPKLSNIWIHDAAVNAGAFDAKGKRILTASEDGTARVWDAETGKAVSAPLEHSSPIKFAELTPDGKYVLTAGADGMLKCWQVDNGATLFTANLAVQYTGLSITEDGTKVAVCGAAGRARIWEIPSGKDVSAMTSAFREKTTAIEFSSDGKTFVMGSADGTARVFQTATSEAITGSMKHTAAITSATFSRDGKRVATSSSDGTAMIWDAATGNPLLATPLRHGDEVTSIRFSPNGKYVVTSSLDRTAQVWDVETGRAIGRPAVHASGINLVSISPDGSWFATASKDNSARVWDLYTGSPISPPFRGNAMPSSVTFSPNGHQLLICRDNRIALLWDLTEATLELNHEEHVPAAPVNAISTVVSPDGTLAISFGSGQTPRIRHASDYESVSPPLRTNGAVTAAAFHPKSQLVATGDVNGGIQLWDAHDGKAQWGVPARHSSRINSFAFSPDGNTLVSCSDDNTVGIWFTDTGKARVPAIRLGTSATSVKFGPSGRTLTTRTAEGSTRVWDAATGEPLTPPYFGRNEVETDLNEEHASIDFLRSLGRVLSSFNVNDNGGLMDFDSGLRRKEYLALREKAPERFAVPAETIRSWYERQALAAEHEGRWFAAAWHLDQLIDMDVVDPELPRRRAIVAAELGDWKRAEADAARMILLRPTKPAGWYQRGVARGHLGNWGDAAADFNVAVSLVNDESFAVGLPALVAIEANDPAAYRAACEKSWADRESFTDAKSMLRLSFSVMVRNDSAIPPDDVITYITPLLTKTPDDPFVVTVYGLALLRKGKLDDAEKTIGPLCLDTKHEYPVTWAIDALIHTKRSNAVHRKSWRDKAAVWVGTSDPKSPPVWDKRTVVRSLLEEVGP